MSRFASWTRLGVAVSGLVLAGCALANGGKSPIVGGPLKSGDQSLNSVAALEPEAGQQLKDGVKEFKDLNSGDSFTMPIGNNFTMPIGNNFTMPIGNNFIGNAGAGLVGNAGAGYRIQATTTSSDVAFGFFPIAAQSEFTFGSGTKGAPPTTGSQTGTVKNPGKFTLDATLTLGAWDDPDPKCAGSCEGFADQIHYNTLSVRAGTATESLSGDYTLSLSGTGWAAGSGATTKYDGLLLLGTPHGNYNPSTIVSRGESMKLARKTTDKTTGKTMADLAVTQSTFTRLDLSVPKQGTQEASTVSVFVPEISTVKGFVGKPDGTAAMGIDLVATASVAARRFSLYGWLRTCATETCSATAADTSVSSAPDKEIRERFELDISGTPKSTTIFERKPKTGQKYGWRLTLEFDYGAAMVKGNMAGSTLSGSLNAIDQDGRDVQVIATIKGDDKGNMIVTYVDGTSETWKL